MTKPNDISARVRAACEDAFKHHDKPPETLYLGMQEYHQLWLYGEASQFTLRKDRRNENYYMGMRLIEVNEVQWLAVA